jgi:hypothetical protein
MSRPHIHNHVAICIVGFWVRNKDDEVFQCWGKGGTIFSLMLLVNILVCKCNSNAIL